MDFIDLKTQYRRIQDDVDRRIRRVLEHGQYILGPEVAELEERLADFVGVKHCIGMSSGTDALLAALMALDIGAGDEVITTPFSFIATAETIALLGATPVFVDIDPATYNIDPAGIEAAITERTRAILPVGLYGQCADLTAINAVAARHGLPVIEDAAQSFGATHHGRRSCGLSTIGCTSFFPSKPLGGYGDGGACFTDDDDLAERLRQIRNHGQDRRYHHARLGLNARLDTLQAAVLLAKLAIYPDEIEQRQRVAANYDAAFRAHGASDTRERGPMPWTPWIAPGNTSVYAQYTIQIPDRQPVIDALAEHNIPTAVHYPTTLVRQPAIGIQRTPDGLDNARAAAGQVVSLPMHSYLGADDLRRIVGGVMTAIDQM